MGIMKQVIFRLLLLLPLCLSLSVQANPFEKRLANGLRVIVKEDHRAPTVVHMAWYVAGSMDEKNGTTGVAHVLEHMMFKGTPTVGAGEFSRLVAEAGGRDNAFTSRDYTAYYQQIPKEHLEEMMRLEADRMRHLTLAPEEFAQEIKVVMEERRMRTEDQPPALLFEQVMSVAFQAHPYRVPVIGWMNDLENMTAEDARHWYDSWYAPNNAFVVVVGDVAHQAVFELAEKYYGPLQAQALPVRKPQTEPKQIGIRRLVVKAPAELPMLLMTYQVPVIRDIQKDTDPFALEMLSAILDGHDAARFSKNLVRNQQIAVSAGAGYDSASRGPGLFYLQGIPAEGKTCAELENAFKEQIREIATNGVSREELERAKAQLVASQIYKLDSMFAQALEIGQLETAGIAHTSSKKMIEKLQAVTQQEVQQVAKQYFDDAHLTVGELDPQPLPNSPRKPSAMPHTPSGLER